MKLVIATRNNGKIKEFQTLLKEQNIDVVSLSEYPDVPETVEDGNTFLENALKKARDVSRHTGEIALADDSGLVVDALDGEPGVLSARYAPTTEERNEKVLKLLKIVPEHARTARFVCALALVRPDGYEWTANGVCEGIIAQSPKGNDGFGYDPIFFYPPLNRTFAEIDREEKNSISHRGNAIRLFLDAVKQDKILARHNTKIQ